MQRRRHLQNFTCAELELWNVNAIAYHSGTVVILDPMVHGYRLLLPLDL